MSLIRLLLLSLLLFFINNLCAAQAPVALTNEARLTINRLEVLTDQHYSPEQVRTDARLHFQPQTVLDTREGGSY